MDLVKNRGNSAENQEASARLAAVLVRRRQTEREPVEQELLQEIPREHRLELVVNERRIARLVCTPGDLEDLVAGRLITEGIVSDLSEIERIWICESGSRAKVFLNKDVAFEAGLAEEPTCCTDNRVFWGKRAAQGGGALSRIERRAAWKPEWIFAMADAFAEDFQLHKRTGGIHGCLLGVEGKVVCRTEDIGRHNALDKAVGYGARAGLAPGKCMLFTTGRVPTDMVRKAVAAGIPVLISKAVPTKEAVEMAEEYGLTLICRAWPDSFEVYAGGGEDRTAE
ncbi:MAG: formate dehydrogenase accessory sulfurtransferase FdhD [Muribaculum sp.]|nr:formate dehydrogenase accessory sulfurtransferase FdhD [Muribaculum sp.]